MIIYVKGKNIVAVTEKDILSIEGAEVFEVDNVPKDFRKYDFINGEFILNPEKELKIKELEEQEKLQAKYDSCKNYIYQYYPQEKQASDSADKEYYLAMLKAKGVKNLEAKIVAMVQKFYEGKSLDEVVKDIVDEDKEAYKQLVKVGIRVSWVQRCKAELKKALSEGREPEYPKYPL